MKPSILKTGLSLILLFVFTTANLRSDSEGKPAINRMGNMKTVKSNLVIEDVPGYETEYTPLGNGIERRKIYTLKPGETLRYRGRNQSDYNNFTYVGDIACFPTKLQNKEFVVLNGKRFRSKSCEFRSPDGKTIAIVYRKNDKDFILFSDGTQVGPYLDAYIFIHGNKKIWVHVQKEDNNWYMISSDGEEFGPYSEIRRAPSPDGNHWVAEVRNSKGTYILNENGRLIGPYSHISDLEYIADGKTWCYQIWDNQKGENKTLCSNGKKIMSKMTKFSKNGKHWVGQQTEYKRGDHEYIITSKGKKYGPYWRILKKQISSDGKHWIATVIIKNGDHKNKTIITSDGKMEEFQDSFIHLNPDGKQWIAEIKSPNKPEPMILTSTGKKSGPYRTLTGRGTFFYDGRRWLGKVYNDPEKKYYIYLSDDKEIGPFNYIYNLMVIPEKQQWMAGVEKANEQYILFSDGVKSNLSGYYEAAEAEIWGPYFRWFQVIGRDVYYYRRSWNESGGK